MVRFSSDEAKHDAHEALCHFFDLAFEGFPSATLPKRNDDYFNAHYLADTLTARQCRLFDQIVNPRP
jgi:hypothetical protein